MKHPRRIIRAALVILFVSGILIAGRLIYFRCCTGLPSRLSEDVSPTPTLVQQTDKTVDLLPSILLFQRSASKIISSKTHQGSLALNTQRISQLTQDGQYVYWTTDNDPPRISRFSLLATTPSETVVRSRYSDGDVGSYGIIRSGDWLVFQDTPSSSGAITWDLRALNLVSGTDNTIVARQNDPASYPGPDFAGRDSLVAFSMIRSGTGSNCAEAVLGISNLSSGKTEELDRVCADRGYRWSFVGVSDHFVVAEKESEAGSDLVLINLNTKERRLLTNDGQGSMPSISYPWITWKSGLRYKASSKFVAYNMRDEKARVFVLPDNEASDPHLSGHWLYWLKGSSVYLYDLEKGQEVLLVTSSPRERITMIDIFNDRIVWVRNRIPDQAKGDFILEWQTLP